MSGRKSKTSFTRKSGSKSQSGSARKSGSQSQSGSARKSGSPKQSGSVRKPGKILDLDCQLKSKSDGIVFSTIRNEFEVEYKYNAEKSIVDLDIDEKESTADLEKKLSILDKYYEVVDERRKIASLHNKLNTSVKIDFSNAEKQMAMELRGLLQYQSVTDHVNFIKRKYQETACNISDCDQSNLPTSLKLFDDTLPDTLTPQEIKLIKELGLDKIQYEAIRNSLITQASIAKRNMNLVNNEITAPDQLSKFYADARWILSPEQKEQMTNVLSQK